MADVGALDAVEMIRGLRCHEKKINEVAKLVRSLVNKLRRTRWLFFHHALPIEIYLLFDAFLIEDVLETFVVDVTAMFQENEPGFTKRFIRKIFPELYYGFVLRNIKKSISEIDHDRHDYSLLVSRISNISHELRVASEDQRRLRQAYPYPRGIGEHFVGRTDELQKLVSLVVKKKTRVISIWGRAGLGKTTIAAKIYEDREVRGHFRAFAWVCLSQGCEINILLLNILSQIIRPIRVNEKTQEMNLIKELKEVLSWRRCLIVLDNVQDMDQWRRLSPAFPMEGGKNVILLTTREENIANEGSPHRLRLLNGNESWDLLKRHAFPRKDAPDVGLFPTLGKEMVQTCEYLPSAISRLGKVLSSKKSWRDWEMVNNNVFQYIKENQIEGDEQLESNLDSEYAKLPYYLKLCFLYLGIFSKNEEIDVEDLYFLWIAEGMVSSLNEVMEKITPCVAEKDGEGEMTVDSVQEEETTLDIANEDRKEMTWGDETIRNEEEKTPDISNIDWLEIGAEDKANENREEPAMNRAEKYLTELTSRGVVRVQWDGLSATRRSQSCFLCSPVQKLFSWEEEKEGIFLEIVDCCNGKQPVPSSSFFPYEIRRMAIHFNQQLEKFDPLNQDGLRSVFLLNTGKKSVEFPLETTSFGKFKLLRILNFVKCKFDGRKLPEGIVKLLNLRYLGLLYCDLDELPLSIGNLRNLRVLNVRVLENYHLRIPEVFDKLVHLNQLRLPYWTDREQTTPKLILGDLLELETLFGFNSLIHDFDSLSKLNKLRLLGAHAYSNDSLKLLLGFITCQGARIRTKLFIENKCDFTSKEGVAVLEGVLICPNLHTLTLAMVLIYKVPDCGNRVSSDLSELTLIGCKITEDPMGALGKFPNLQKLCLGHGAFVGKKMAVQANGFPKLAYLEIRSLPYFEEWSLDEGAMPNLFELIIRRCPRLKMIPDGLKSISNLKKLEIELAPEAFVDVSEEEYRQKFHFVHTLNIRYQLVEVFEVSAG